MDSSWYVVCGDSRADRSAEAAGDSVSIAKTCGLANMRSGSWRLVKDGQTCVDLAAAHSEDGGILRPERVSKRRPVEDWCLLRLSCETPRTRP